MLQTALRMLVLEALKVVQIQEHQTAVATYATQLEIATSCNTKKDLIIGLFYLNILNGTLAKIYFQFKKYVKIKKDFKNKNKF